jgi:uncharacterized Zn finger protein
MSWYYDENTAELKAAVLRKIAKRRKLGEIFEVFEAPKGTKLTTSFWGQAWCRHLEQYGGYETRLPKGRTYLRQGNVYNLRTAAGVVTAEVAGSDLYEVKVRLTPLTTSAWQGIKEQCGGQVASLLDLLSGKLGDGVMKVVTDPDTGLFPKRKEIRHGCSCPDYADLCKHQAAVLYAIGVRFDQDPRSFFELRGVDPAELIASSAAALTEPGALGGDELEGEDLSALFGIELAGPEGVPVAAAGVKPKGKKKPAR